MKKAKKTPCQTGIDGGPVDNDYYEMLAEIVLHSEEMNVDEKIAIATALLGLRK